MMNERNIAQEIRNKRLSLNLTMEYVAKKAGITRATLSAIENGSIDCSFRNLLSIFRVLNISINVNSNVEIKKRRERATRTNTALEKKINMFIVFCIEQYAISVNKNNSDIYKQALKKGIIKYLHDDYEDLHGMSTAYMNNYISTLIKQDSNL